MNLKQKSLISSLLLLATVALGNAQSTLTQLSQGPVRITNAQLALLPNPPVPLKKRVKKNEETEREREIKGDNPAAPAVASWPPVPTPIGNDLLVRPNAKVIGNGKQYVNREPNFSVGTSFSGPLGTESPYTPPDSTGDAGLTSIIAGANGRIKSYTRTGTTTAFSLNADPDVFFSPLGANLGISDPKVVFDRTTNRWFITAITTNADPGNKVVIAWSSIEDVNSASNVWTLVSFTPGTGGTGFSDYDTLGVDKNGIYIGINLFLTAGGINTLVCAVPKAALISGAATPITTFVTCTGGAGMWTPQPCTNDDPSATSAFVVGVDNAVFSLLKARRISFTAPTTFSSSADLSLTVPTTTFPRTVPIFGGQNADALDDRLFNARVFTDQNGNPFVLTSHNIRTTAAGVASSTGPVNGSRWYQIGNPFAGTITLSQSGTSVDSAGSKSLWIPSIAMNRQGHAFLGGSIASSTTSPGVGGTERLATDTAGLMTAPVTYVAGSGTFDLIGGTERWGDYSVTTIDPRDGQSFWTFQEYVSATNVWQVRVVKVLAPAPAVTSISPASVSQGFTGNIVVTGTNLFDGGSSFPDRLAATLGAGVTVNSIAWNSSTQATVNVSVAEAATVGTRTVALTNPDGQVSSLANGLTITQLVKNVSGSLTLSNYLGSSTSLPFTLELRNATTNAILQTVNLTGLGSGNTFAFTTTQLSGSYKLRVKAAKRFLGVVQNVTLSLSGASGISYTLTNGDVDGNNTVNNADYTLMRAVWGSLGNGPSNGADLNGDGSVGNLDFAILRANLGQSGQ